MNPRPSSVRKIASASGVIAGMPNGRKSFRASSFARSACINRLSLGARKVHQPQQKQPADGERGSAKLHGVKFTDAEDPPFEGFDDDRHRIEGDPRVVL